MENNKDKFTGSVEKIMSGVHKENLRRAAYELYKHDWISRNFSPARQTDLHMHYIDYIIEHFKEPVRCTFEEYLRESRARKPWYLRYEDFLKCVYTDGTFMAALLGDDDRYQLYKEHDELFASGAESKHHDIAHKQRLAVTYEMLGYIDVAGGTIAEAMNNFYQRLREGSQNKIPANASYVKGSLRLASNDPDEMEFLVK